MSTLILKRTQK